MAVSSTGRQPLARLTGWLLLSTQQSLPVPALVCWLGANLCPHVGCIKTRPAGMVDER